MTILAAKMTRMASMAHAPKGTAFTTALMGAAAYPTSFTFSLMLWPYTERNSRPELRTIARTLRSSKVVAYWRRAISSNCGCRQEPLGVGCWSVWADGVVGMGGVAECAFRASDMVSCRRSLCDGCLFGSRGRLAEGRSASVTCLAVVVLWS